MKLGRSAGLWSVAEGPEVAESVSSEFCNCSPGEDAEVDVWGIAVFLTFLLW